MKLIDADALYDIVIDSIKPMTTNEAIILQDFVALLEDAPTVDAEPVVRCKDCKYFYPWGNGLVGGFCLYPNAPIITNIDYCSYCSLGKRKENE